MGKATEQETPLEAAARTSMARETLKQGYYMPERFTERGTDKGEIDNARMFKAVCVRPLEAMVKPNARRKHAGLTSLQIQTANEFHALILKTEPSRSHELMEYHDKSRTSGGIHAASVQDACRKLKDIELRMRPNHWAHARTLFIYKSNETFADAYPYRGRWPKIRDEIRDMLDWVSSELGLASMHEKGYVVG